MKLTAQIKLLPIPEQVEALLDAMWSINAAADHAAKVGFANQTYSLPGIQRLCYYELREAYRLSSHMAVRAIGKAADCFARDRKACPAFAPYGAVPLDGDLYRLMGKGTASIRVLEGRIKVPIIVPQRFAFVLTRKMGQADLVYRGKQFYLYITVEAEEPKPIKPKRFIGVDLGVVNLATDSTGEMFSGEQVERHRKRRATARKQYQRKGTKNAKQRLKQMGGRQSRYQHWVNHNISKRLVDKAKALKAGIALEDLKHIRSRLETTVSRKFKRRLGNWSFAHLRQCIEYKGRLAGVPVLTVNPRNSSRTCSECGHCEKANRKDQATFKCKHCGYSTNADLNAALNLSAWAVPKPAPKAAGHKGLAAKFLGFGRRDA